MTLAHRSLQLRIARVGEKGATGAGGEGKDPGWLGEDREGKSMLVRGCPQILRAPVFPLASVPLVASSVFTTLQVRKSCGFGVEEKLEGE